MDSQNNLPHDWIDRSDELSDSEKHLAGRLKSLADESSLRPAFKQRLQAELIQSAQAKPDRAAAKPARGFIPGWAFSAAAMAGLLLLLAIALLTLPQGQPSPAVAVTPTRTAETSTPTLNPATETPTPAATQSMAMMRQSGLLMPPDQQVCEEWRDTLSRIFGTQAEQVLAPTLMNSAFNTIEQDGMGCLVEVALPGEDIADLEEPLDWIATLLSEQGLTEQGEQHEPEQFDPILYGDWFGKVRFFEGDSLWALLSASWIPAPEHSCRLQPGPDCEVLPEDRVSHIRLLLTDHSLQDVFIALAHDDPAALDGLTPELRQSFRDTTALKRATGVDELMHPETLQLGGVFGWFDDGNRTANLEVRLRDLLSSRMQPFSRLNLDVVYQDGRWRIAGFIRLENEIPEPEPTPTPLPLLNPPAFDPKAIEPVTYASEDGRWLADVWTIFPNQLPAEQRNGDFNFLRVIVRAAYGAAEFTVLEQWEPAGLGAPQPAEFIWTEDALIFTWKSVPDGCGGFGFDHWLYQVDLQTGETEQIEFPHEGDLSVSPDGTQAAYLLEEALGVYDLNARESVATISLPLGFDTPYQAIGGMVWSPDQKQILLSTWMSWCGPVDGQTEVWLLDLETQEWIEIVPAGDVNYEVTGWPEPDRIELRDQEQQPWVLDPTTGELRQEE